MYGPHFWGDCVGPSGSLISGLYFSGISHAYDVGKQKTNGVFIISITQPTHALPSHTTRPPRCSAQEFTLHKACPNTPQHTHTPSSPLPSRTMFRIVAGLFAILVNVAPDDVEIGVRTATSEELTRCGVQFDALADMHISYSIARTVKGFDLAVYTPTGTVTDFVSEELLRVGSWEGATAARTLAFAGADFAEGPGMWRSCTAPPCKETVMIDVGANLGWWSFVAAAEGWHVVAIEAAPPTAALFELSMCLNPSLAERITFKHTIVGEAEQDCAVLMPAANFGAAASTTCTFKDKHVEWTENVMARLKDAANRNGTRLERVFRVPVVRLGDLLEDVWEQDRSLAGTAALLKLDIEGGEYGAMNGTRAWLKKGRVRTVHSEVWADIHGGVDGYLSMFTKFGYAVCKFFVLSRIDE